MPHIEISIREGRSEEVVRRLIHGVSAATVEALGVRPESVQVIVTEVPDRHWARGDVTLAEKYAESGDRP